jgi:GNAT superfamily N-acetyltransferase
MQIHLYVSELLSTLSTAIETGRPVQIWGDYWVRLTGGQLMVLKNGFEKMGRMYLSRTGPTVFFSKLLTTPGYERQGIGSLVVLLGILYAHLVGAGLLRLGEEDVNRTQGGHFWLSLHLSDQVNTPIGTALEAMMESQRVLARKLNASLDPNAILVAFRPTRRGKKTTTRLRSRSFD